MLRPQGMLQRGDRGTERLIKQETLTKYLFKYIYRSFHL